MAKERYSIFTLSELPKTLLDRGELKRVATKMGKNEKDPCRHYGIRLLEVTNGIGKREIVRKRRKR
jgi:hypothetical protein